LAPGLRAIFASSRARFRAGGEPVFRQGLPGAEMQRNAIALSVFSGEMWSRSRQSIHRTAPPACAEPPAGLPPCEAKLSFDAVLILRK
jgi:hypothetical protein